MIKKEQENKLDKELDEAKKLHRVAKIKATALRKLEEVKDKEKELINNRDNNIENEYDENENEYTPTDEEIEVENFLQNFNQTGAKVSVSRWKDDTNTWARIGDYPLEDIKNNIDMIAKKFGGGLFKFVIRNTNGQYIKQFTQTFDILAYPEKTNTAIIPTQDNSIVKDVIKEIKETSKENQTQLTQLFSTFMGTLSEILAGVIENKRNQPQVDPLQQIKTLKEILDIDNKEKTNPLQDVKSLINVLKTGIDLGSNIGNKVEANSDDEGIVEKLLKKVIGGVGESKLSEVIEKAVIPEQQKPVIRQNPIQTTQQVIKSGGNMAESMSGLETLVKMNIKPEKIVKTFIDSADDFTFNLLNNLKDDREESKKAIIGFLPFLTKYPEWTEKAITYMITYLYELERIENEETVEKTDEQNKNI